MVVGPKSAQDSVLIRASHQAETGKKLSTRHKRLPGDTSGGVPTAMGLSSRRKGLTDTFSLLARKNIALLLTSVCAHKPQRAIKTARTAGSRGCPEPHPRARHSTEARGHPPAAPGAPSRLSAAALRSVPAASR